MVSLFLRINIETDAVDGKVLVSECSRLFHESLRVPIERLLGEAADKGKGEPEIVISHMVLDLGDLSVTHWRTELAARLMRQLTTALAGLGRSGESATDDDVPLPDLRHATKVAAPTRRNVVGRSTVGTSGLIASRTVVSRTAALPAPTASKVAVRTAASRARASPNVAARTIARKPKAASTEKATVAAISAAGLVLLWPFLARWWSAMGYTEKGAFRDAGAQCRAVKCLDGLAGAASTATGFSHPTVSALLCGLPLDAAFLLQVERAPAPASAPQSERHIRHPGAQCDPPEKALSNAEHRHLTAWRDSLPALLPGLERCGPQDIKSLFLQRPGTVRTQNGVLTLHVERDASDILLRSIPWPMQQLVLPWLKTPLKIDWL